MHNPSSYYHPEVRLYNEIPWEMNTIPLVQLALVKGETELKLEELISQAKKLAKIESQLKPEK